MLITFVIYGLLIKAKLVFSIINCATARFLSSIVTRAMTFTFLKEELRMGLITNYILNNNYSERKKGIQT